VPRVLERHHSAAEIGVEEWALVRGFRLVIDRAAVDLGRAVIVGGEAESRAVDGAGVAQPATLPIELAGEDRVLERGKACLIFNSMISYLSLPQEVTTAQLRLGTMRLSA